MTGKIYSPVEIVEIYIEVLDAFKLENPGFIGAKFIYAPVRIFDDTFFASYMETAKALHVIHFFIFFCQKFSIIFLLDTIP